MPTFYPEYNGHVYVYGQYVYDTYDTYLTGMIIIPVNTMYAVYLQQNINIGKNCGVLMK